MNYIERFNLVLSAKIEISKDGNLGGLVVVTSTLSAVLSTKSMYAEFPSCTSQSSYQQGRFGSLKRNLRRTLTSIFSLKPY